MVTVSSVFNTHIIRFFTSDSEDFSTNTTELVFNSSSTCFVINITDDRFVEHDTGFHKETFFVRLENAEDNRTIIDGDRFESSVYIMDDDSMCAFHVHNLSFPFPFHVHTPIQSLDTVSLLFSFTVQLQRSSLTRISRWCFLKARQQRSVPTLLMLAILTAQSNLKLQLPSSLKPTTLTQIVQVCHRMHHQYRYCQHCRITC